MPLKDNAEIALIAVHTPGKIKRTAVLAILFHLQTNITNGNLFVVFMLEYQNTVGNAANGRYQTTTLCLPPDRATYCLLGQRRIFTAHRLSLAGSVESLRL